MTAKPRRIVFPLFEVQPGPTIPLQDLLDKRFYLLARCEHGRRLAECEERECIARHIHES